MSDTAGPSTQTLPGHRAFQRAFMLAVSGWTTGRFIGHVLGSMIGLWLGWLGERTERRLAQIDAREAAGVPAVKAPAQPRARPARARKPRQYEHEWQIPPQWTTPFTWPQPAGPGPRQVRPAGWLIRHMGYHAVPLKLMLEATLGTPEMVRLFTHSRPAIREWTPLLRMLGVDTNLIRHPGQTPPPRRKRASRPPMTKHEKWWRALARDPNPGYRRVVVHDGTNRGLGFHSREELRPKGCAYREAVDPPPGWTRTAW